MRKSVIIGLIASTLLVFGTSAASALSLSVVLNEGSSVFTNPVVAGANGPEIDLVVGDTIAVNVIVDNSDNPETIEAIFASVLYNTDQLSFLGGGFAPILQGTCTGFGCVEPVLVNGIPSPVQKPLSPFGQGTGVDDWIQALAHTNADGTLGEGPDSGVLLGFEVLAGGVGPQLDLIVFLDPNSDIISGPDGPIDAELNNLSINVVPEPGTALLMGLGLAGLGVAGRRES